MAVKALLSAALLWSTALSKEDAKKSHHGSDGSGRWSKLLGDFDCRRIGFFKTHKTGSSSVSVMLGKVGLMQRKRFSPCPRCPDGHQGQQFSIEHHTGAPYVELHGLWLSTLKRPGFITMVREPVSRHISHYFYYGYRSWLEDVNEGLLLYQPRPWQAPSQAQELVHRSEEGLALRTRLWVRSAQFQQTFFVVLERLAESVAALHLHCGWPMRELYFGNVHCKTCWDVEVARKGLRAGAQASYGLNPEAFARASALMADTAKQSRNITRETREAIGRSLEADQILYEAAVAKLDSIVHRGGAVLAAAARELTRRNALVEEHCRRAVQAPEDFLAEPGCLWIALLPKEFYALYRNTTDSRVDLQRRFEMHFNSAEHNGLERVMEKGLSAGAMHEDFNRLYASIIGTGNGWDL